MIYIEKYSINRILRVSIVVKGDVPEVAGLVVGLQEGGRHLSARV
jgi:hypothetical protein